MYAQAVRVQLQADKADEAAGIFRDSVLPAVRQQNGFISVKWLIDRENNRGIGFSLWETRADVDALATSGFYQEQIGKFAAVFSAPPEREIYEVAVES